MKLFYKGSRDLLVGDAQSEFTDSQSGVSTMSPVYLVSNDITEVNETDSVRESLHKGILKNLIKRGLLEIVTDNMPIVQKQNFESVQSNNNLEQKIDVLTNNVNKLAEIMSNVLIQNTSKKEVGKRGRPKGSKNVKNR